MLPISIEPCDKTLRHSAALSCLLRYQAWRSHNITTHSQTPIFCIVFRVDKRYI